MVTHPNWAAQLKATLRNQKQLCATKSNFAQPKATLNFKDPKRENEKNVHYTRYTLNVDKYGRFFDRGDCNNGGLIVPKSKRGYEQASRSDKTTIDIDGDDKTTIDIGGDDKTTIDIGGDDKTTIDIGGDDKTTIDIGGDDKTTIDIGGDDKTTIDIGGDDKTTIDIGGDDKTTIDIGGDDKTTIDIGGDDKTTITFQLVDMTKLPSIFNWWR
ncbi:hypothetical protein M8J77_011294 [Diaphorina citri]|nr:hypothetical protein M8J77_011294 [Diaphorina citri]